MQYLVIKTFIIHLKAELVNKDRSFQPSNVHLYITIIRGGVVYRCDSEMGLFCTTVPDGTSRRSCYLRTLVEVLSSW